MGDPLTTAAAGGMGVSLIGSVMKAGAEQNQLEAKRQADLQNQQVNLMQAADVLRRGAIQAGQIEQQGGQVVGTERAGYGASGVDANTGSAAAVEATTRGMSDLDAQTALNNATRAAWGFKVSANQLGTQAGLDEQAKGEALEGSILGGIGHAIGAGGRLYGADKGNLGGGFG